jgi:hypothetical protein
MEEQKTPTETEINQKLADEFNSKREKFTLDMIMYRGIYEQNTTNDHPFFLYLGSILNYIESHNGGSLTELGMKSLQLDISDFILHLQEGGFNKLHQKELVRFLLNILNSYAVCVLATGLLEFAKTNDTFFELNPFPSAIRDDFPALQEKALDLIPKLKQVLDAYTTYLEPKYRTIFNQEKTKGFVKQIFNDSVVKLGSKSFPMNDVANSKEMKLP